MKSIILLTLSTLYLGTGCTSPQPEPQGPRLADIKDKGPATSDPPPIIKFKIFPLKKKLYDPNEDIQIKVKNEGYETIPVYVGIVEHIHEKRPDGRTYRSLDNLFSKDGTGPPTYPVKVGETKIFTWNPMSNPDLFMPSATSTYEISIAPITVEAFGGPFFHTETFQFSRTPDPISVE